MLPTGVEGRLSSGQTRWRGLGFAVALILLADVPWTTIQWHPHWDRVGWIPFVSPPVRAVDIAVNVALFVPFGFYAGRANAPLAASMIAATLLSFACELLQVYSHGRFPSATDLTCNVIGAAIGTIGSRISGRQT